ncbi:MAG TPA: hypothetical protein VJ804_09690 [Acidimicrobiales bacterium]|nr:hypothetical protein [Acidimicrobiales bacterium]
MEMTTLTTAGHMCHAGDARLAAGSQGVYGHHQSATWTKGAIFAEPTVFVLDRKNRPTRQPQGVSP